MSTEPQPVPACVALGCLGTTWCAYCGDPLTDAESLAVRVAAGRVRAGDITGALAVLNTANQP